MYSFVACSFLLWQVFTLSRDVIFCDRFFPTGSPSTWGLHWPGGPDWLMLPRIDVVCGGLLVWAILAPIFAHQPHTLVGNFIKPFTGLAAIFPLAYVSRFAARIPGCASVGESTLAIYCVEGVIGWRLFQMLSPSLVVLSVAYSLALILVVHWGMRGLANLSSRRGPGERGGGLKA